MEGLQLQIAEFRMTHDRHMICHSERSEESRRDAYRPPVQSEMLRCAQHDSLARIALAFVNKKHPPFIPRSAWVPSFH
jgi:hypothetical protein